MTKIPGYEGYYATEQGLIISYRSGEAKVLSQRIHKGYYHVQIKKGTNRKTQVKVPVHQLVLSAFKVKLSDNLVCRHLDGNPLNNNINNLEWGTTKENVMDSIIHGTAVCLRLGENHPHSKLKQDIVIKIKELIRQGLSNRLIADITGVKTYNVNDIRAGKAWRHLGA